jgi:hypothetical protein
LWVAKFISCQHGRRHILLLGLPYAIHADSVSISAENDRGCYVCQVLFPSTVDVPAASVKMEGCHVDPHGRDSSAGTFLLSDGIRGAESFRSFRSRFCSATVGPHVCDKSHVLEGIPASKLLKHAEVLLPHNSECTLRGMSDMQK